MTPDRWKRIKDLLQSDLERKPAERAAFLQQACAGDEVIRKDGELIYYTTADKNNPHGALYQLPALGGMPRKLLSSIIDAVSFSPDGKQFCFVRHENGQEANALMIANSDGSRQQMIAERKDDNYFSEHPAWSPDGKTIACGVGILSNTAATVIGISVDGGVERPLTSQKWQDVFSVLWLKDGSGLIVSAS